ncbi:MAG: Uma2 family endonuclease [Verrucomicrobia bacterium]|nr:Uma2 family endonuclease [Verrucomicrobiota bacterium]
MPVRPDAPPLTVEHYRMLPETGPRYQLVNGDLYMSPAPNRYHQVISRNLEFILMQYLEAQPLGELYDAPFDVYLSDVDVFQPDIAIVLNRNRGILTAAGAEGAPDFVVEILSPKTRKLDLEQKRRVYAREGVTELWIIDPDPQTVTVYRFAEDAEHPVMVKRATETLGSPLLPGLAVDLNRVFREYRA